MNNLNNVEQIYNLLDNFIEKYYEYFKDSDNDDKKNECVNNIYIVQNILLKNNNYNIIIDDFSNYIDNKIEDYNNLGFITILFDNIFSIDFFNKIISYSLKFNVYHYNICVLLIIKMTLYYKYVEEDITNEDEAKNILKIILPTIFDHIIRIYKDIENKTELINEKERIMELLCSFDLEDIYNDDE